MKTKYLLITVLLTLFMVITGCGQATESSKDGTKPKPVEKTTLTAGEVLSGLKAAGLTIGESMEYTAETDTNKLLGRPGQYIEKINFDDTLVEESDNTFANSIEVFNNTDDLNNRANYIKKVTEGVPLLTQYMYIHKNVLLRLDKAFTPAQAAKYEKALKKL